MFVLGFLFHLRLSEGEDIHYICTLVYHQEKQARAVQSVLASDMYAMLRIHQDDAFVCHHPTPFHCTSTRPPISPLVCTDRLSLYNLNLEPVITPNSSLTHLSPAHTEVKGSGSNNPATVMVWLFYPRGVIGRVVWWVIRVIVGADIRFFPRVHVSQVHVHPRPQTWACELCAFPRWSLFSFCSLVIP